MGSVSGMRSLARRYARGLAEAAPKDLSKAAAALDGWRETVKHSPTLPGLLFEPRLPKPMRTELAREIFSMLGAPPALLNLITLLIDDNRFGLLDPIHTAFIDEREKREGIRCAIIETPVPLSDNLRERIRSRLAEIWRLHVRIEERIKPAVLAGINVRSGSRVWYGSALHRLEQVFR